MRTESPDMRAAKRVAALAVGAAVGLAIHGAAMASNRQLAATAMASSSSSSGHGGGQSTTSSTDSTSTTDPTSSTTTSSTAVTTTTSTTAPADTRTPTSISSGVKTTTVGVPQEVDCVGYEFFGGYPRAVLFSCLVAHPVPYVHVGGTDVRVRLTDSSGHGLAGRTLRVTPGWGQLGVCAAPPTDSDGFTVPICAASNGYGGADVFFDGDESFAPSWGYTSPAAQVCWFDPLWGPSAYC